MAPQPQYAVAAAGGQTTCTVHGCDKKINQRCLRQACASHCRIQGGCALTAHAPKADAPNLAPQTPTANPSYNHGPPPSPPIPPHPNQSFTPHPCQEPPTSMNPLPNPRHASQIWPIFIEENARKEEVLRLRQVQDAERLDANNWVKHEVTVCAWLLVSLFWWYIITYAQFLLG